MKNKSEGSLPTPLGDAPTPRTDAMIDSCGDYEKWHSYRDRLHAFARQLERELAAAKQPKEQRMPPIGQCHCPDPDDCLYGGPACADGEERKRRRATQSESTRSITVDPVDFVCLKEPRCKAPCGGRNCHVAPSAELSTTVTARVKALEAIESIVLDYVKDYEWRGDEACHYPDANERALIADAIAGLHADDAFVSAWDAWRALCRATQSAKEEIKSHYHRGGLSAEKCPLCRDAERLSWLNLHWEQIEYGGGDLGKLRELIDAAMHATVGPTATK